jgi:hypothetical protein
MDPRRLSDLVVVPLLLIVEDPRSWDPTYTDDIASDNDYGFTQCELNFGLGIFYTSMGKNPSEGQCPGDTSNRGPITKTMYR